MVLTNPKGNQHMGTRSLTFVHEEDGTPVVCIYRQYDGYFDGVGDDILTFLKGSQIVNGIGMDPANIFNGAGDLAARLITHYKGGNADDAGNTYIYPTDTSDVGEEFVYRIHCTVGQEPRLVATDVYAQFTVDAPVSEIVWPTQDEDGNYVVVPTDTSGPLTDEQRRALFAAFREAFDGADDTDRYTFTRKILGKPAAAVVSWSDAKRGTITADEASRLLDVLAAVNAVR